MTLGDELHDDQPGVERGRRCAERWHRRRGLERRLHDGPALRLSALSLRLGLLRAETDGAGRAAWARGLDDVADELGAALQELREVAAEIYPPLLDEAGLGPALRELATATRADVRVDAVDTRCGTAAEGAAYFATAACLAAAGDGRHDGRHDNRHDGRGETGVDVRVRVESGELVLTLAGVDPALHDVVLDEAAPLGGSVRITDTGAACATITARFPCV